MKHSVTSAKASDSVKVRRISAKIKQAIDILISGGAASQKQAAAAVGLSPEHLSRSLKEPHVQAFITRRVGQDLAQGQMRASAVLRHLLEASSSEHVKKDLALYLLELGGHLSRPGGVTINNNLQTAGYIIRLSTPPDTAPPFEDRATEARLVEAQELPAEELPAETIEHDADEPAR